MPLDDPTFTNPYLMHFLSSPSTVATLAALGLIAVVVALAVPRRRFLVLATGVSAAAQSAASRWHPSRGWTTLALSPQPLEAVRTALRPDASTTCGRGPWPTVRPTSPSSSRSPAAWHSCCGARSGRS